MLPSQTRDIQKISLYFRVGIIEWVDNTKVYQDLLFDVKTKIEKERQVLIIVTYFVNDCIAKFRLEARGLYRVFLTGFFRYSQLYIENTIRLTETK